MEYKIDGITCSLKNHDDMTLEEMERINKIISNFEGENNVIYTKFTNNDLITFLETVLIHNGDIKPNYKKCTNKVALQVVKDFFLDRISSLQHTMQPLRI